MSHQPTNTKSNFVCKSVGLVNRQYLSFSISGTIFRDSRAITQYTAESEQLGYTFYLILMTKTLRVSQELFGRDASRWLDKLIREIFCIDVVLSSSDSGRNLCPLNFFFDCPRLSSHLSWRSLTWHYSREMKMTLLPLSLTLRFAK